MTPTFFPTPAEFRQWLNQHHAVKKELWVGFYKKDSRIPSITWSESVDQALCFGWIDGIRKSIDDNSYKIRFTPRKPGSIWSAININKIEVLTAEGLMFPAGLAAYEKRQDHKSRIYAYEMEPMTLHETFEQQLQSNEKALAFFMSQAPSYRKTAIKWVMTAKQETTRQSRLNTLIADSEAGQKIAPLRYSDKKR
jgi:uncharacterized protein YdeI (YjbR/CyaY-like superfamily)